MNNIYKCILLFFISLTIGYAYNQDLYPFEMPEDASRFEVLTQQIRCVVCQNQSLADSNAPLANDLREKIYRMVKDNKSNTEIKDYLVKRYGEFILLQPKLNLHTLLLWTFPLAGLCFTFFFMLRSSKNRSKV